MRLAGVRDNRQGGYLSRWDRAAGERKFDRADIPTTMQELQTEVSVAGMIAEDIIIEALSCLNCDRWTIFSREPSMELTMMRIRCGHCGSRQLNFASKVEVIPNRLY